MDFNKFIKEICKLFNLDYDLIKESADKNLFDRPFYFSAEELLKLVVFLKVKYQKTLDGNFLLNNRYLTLNLIYNNMVDI